MTAITRDETLDRVPHEWLDTHDMTYFFVMANVGRTPANPSPHHRGGGKALDTREVGGGAGGSSASVSLWFYRAWVLTWVTPMLVWVLS